MVTDNLQSEAILQAHASDLECQVSAQTVCILVPSLSTTATVFLCHKRQWIEHYRNTSQWHLPHVYYIFLSIRPQLDTQETDIRTTLPGNTFSGYIHKQRINHSDILPPMRSG